MMEEHVTIFYGDCTGGTKPIPLCTLTLCRAKGRASIPTGYKGATEKRKKHTREEHFSWS